MLRYVAFAFFLFIAYVLIAANTGTEVFFYDLIKDIPHRDKIGHFTLVGMLSFFANALLHYKTYRLSGHELLLGSTLILVLFTIEEASQYYIPTRQCDIVDLCCNYLGIFVFARLGRWWNNQSLN